MLPWAPRGCCPTRTTSRATAGCATWSRPTGRCASSGTAPSALKVHLKRRDERMHAHRRTGRLPTRVAATWAARRGMPT